MKTGRKPTPTADLKLHGGYRNDRHAGRADAAPPDGFPVKPDEFGEVESALWDRVVPILVRRRIVGELDTPQLVSMCRWWRHYQTCDELLDIDPTDKNVGVRAVAYWTAFDRIASKYGLTAADMAGLKVPKESNKAAVPTRTRAS